MSIRTITIPEAIDKGIKLIDYPLRGILAASVVLPAIFLFLGFIKCGLLLLIVGFTTYFLYDLWAIPKWRLWAYEHVNDIHQFQRTAELEGLLIRQAYDKCIGFMTFQQKRKLVALLERFSQEATFTDDASVPEATIFFQHGIENDPPLLKLDSHGIKIEQERIGWEKLSEERIARLSYDSEYNVADPTRRYSNNVFRFDTSSHRYEVTMEELNISASRLDYLLYIYRGRHLAALKSSTSTT